MATNDFLPFGAGAGANVLVQADYAALPARLTGFSAGTAKSIELNKVWRQSSIMSAVLAQLIVDLTGQNAIDDGTLTTLLANLKAAIGLAASGRFLSVQRFMTGGTYTYTPTPGMKRARVIVIGAGGAGAGIPNTFVGYWSIGGGGGSGAISGRIFTSAEIGASQVVTVGAGGVSNSGVSAVNGGTSSFGTLITCPGGGGGSVYNSAQSGTGFVYGRGLPAAVGSGGDWNFPGAQGLSGIAYPGSTSGEGPSNGGKGADSPWTGTGGGTVQSGSTIGGAGSAPGAGGAGTSGSAMTSGSVGITARPGGNGADGMTYIEEYA